MNSRIPLLLAGSLLAATLTGCSADQAGTADASAGATGTASATTSAAASVPAAGSSAEQVLAANAEVHAASLDYDEGTVVEVSLSAGTASSDSDAVVVDGGTVTITAPGTYRLTGTLSDGQVVVDSAAEGTMRIVLAGVAITSSTTSALAIMDADEAVILLADGTSNTLVDATTYVHPDSQTDEPNAALFSSADLTIAGTGSLTVTGNSNDGIASKDGLAITGASVQASAVDDGIRGKDYVSIQDADVTVQSGGDGIKADNDEDTDKGFIVVRAGTVTVTSGDDGLTAATDLVVSGGTLAVTAGGGAPEVSQDSGAKGLVAQAALIIDDGTLTVDAADDALHSNGIVTIAGGQISASAGDDGIHADTDITISAGTIGVLSSYEGVESNDVTISGGQIDIAARDDGINLAGGNDASAQAGPGDQQGDFGGRTAADADGSRPQPAQVGGPGGGNEAAGDQLLTISGGHITIDSDGDGLDSNGAAVMTGGTVVVHGPTNDGNAAIDVNGSFEVSGGTLTAAGSAGMAETPDAASAQAWLAATLNATQPAGAVISIRAGDTVLATFTATKQMQSLVYSSEQLVAGEAYDVLLDGTEVSSVTASGQG